MNSILTVGHYQVQTRGFGGPKIQKLCGCHLWTIPNPITRIEKYTHPMIETAAKSVHGSDLGLVIDVRQDDVVPCERCV